ncbi:cytochrome c-type biogenesis protein CcmH [Pelomonas aquatica]|uniref:Cytochrome c-type biogenesis protein n=1 Tax=Pelomonas aquatica TaxID=431058 RepID=A0ABU1Z847_9BURK|nr:cytochrome c-type biogenesis protein [Pelomonas aquatica]MDR7296797.1 cytochrome c-type biogenesis protein CcmH [Pelomonas aquatica]
MKALLLAFMLCATLARADAPAELEAREARLAAQLRCVVCQNQTVAESNAPLAADMRREIRTQLQAGRSDGDVIAFFEQRYGAFVHYTPPLRPSTWLLWAGPFVGAAAGIATLLAALRRRGRQAPSAALSAADKARAERLLAEETTP